MRLEVHLGDKRARMGGDCASASVIVLIVYDVSMSVPELEGETPVAVHRDRPSPALGALEGVRGNAQAELRDVAFEKGPNELFTPFIARDLAARQKRLWEAAASPPPGQLCHSDFVETESVQFCKARRAECTGVPIPPARPDGMIARRTRVPEVTPPAAWTRPA